MEHNWIEMKNNWFDSYVGKNLYKTKSIYNDRIQASRKYYLNFIKGFIQPKLPKIQTKYDAMKQLEKEHNRDYRIGTFRDPLGVAVQQTFGMGLSYTFDHFDALPSDQEPSLRRLQARAAKSSIKRVQQIYDNVLDDDKFLDNMNYKERENYKKEVRERDEAEINHLKNELIELVPKTGEGRLHNTTQVEEFLNVNSLEKWIIAELYRVQPNEFL